MGEEPGKKVFSQLRKNRPKFIDFRKKHMVMELGA